MKIIITLNSLLLGLGVFILTGCTQQQTSPIQSTVTIPTVQQPTVDQPVASTSIMYYHFNKLDGSPDFCDGENMDSAGYKAALTEKTTQTVPGSLTIENKIITTLGLAADAEGFNQVYANTAATTFENGTVTIHSANGWAGSSIFYCSWKPFVEKNLEQFLEVKKIKWVPEN